MLKPNEIIEALKPCSYKYNETMDLGDKVNFGFLAQDLLEAFGDQYNFVNKNEETGFYKVNYFQFIAPIVSYIKTQQQEIESLKEEIKKLKEER